MSLILSFLLLRIAALEPMTMVLSPAMEDIYEEE